MDISNIVKTPIRRAIGLWPAWEIWNQIVLAPALPKLFRFENSEVERLRSQQDAIPSARIACIVPTFKRPESLIASVKSILAQERQDFIVVIVDDGAGLPVLPSDPRIFSVSLSHNCAVLGLVRNVGIRLSNSEFIAFLDDDNIWTPRHLTAALQRLERGADLVYTAVRRRKPDGSELDVLSKPFHRRRFSDEPSWIDANSIVLRRSVCRPFSRLPRTRRTLPKEDWEFVWRISRNARVEHVPEVTVEYLVNPASYYTAWSIANE